MEGLETTGASREALARWIKTTGDLNIPCGTSTAAVLRDVDRLTALLDRQVAPPSLIPDAAPDDNDPFHAGWNKCREEILERQAAPVEGLEITRRLREYQAALTHRAGLAIVDNNIVADTLAGEAADTIDRLTATVAAREARANRLAEVLRRACRYPYPIGCCETNPVSSRACQCAALKEPT